MNANYLDKESKKYQNLNILQTIILIYQYSISKYYFLIVKATPTTTNPAPIKSTILV